MLDKIIKRWNEKLTNHSSENLDKNKIAQVYTI